MKTMHLGGGSGNKHMGGLEGRKGKEEIKSNYKTNKQEKVINKS